MELGVCYALDIQSVTDAEFRVAVLWHEDGDTCVRAEPGFDFRCNALNEED